MTAQGLDNYNYEPANRHDSESDRRHYWAVAIGLQDVDGLQVSSYLREEANKYIAGMQTLEETGALIRQHHAQGNDAQGNNTQGNDTQGNDRSSLEADLVSQRIVELLASKAFALAPGFLTQVHRHLFQDLDQAIYHAGEFKTQRMIKQEEILNGDSVLYADPSTYEMSLAGAFAAEQAKNYQTLDADELADFCHFISFLWQIHPFYEGNTRTTAVFSELYLNYLGFSVTNDPFEKHARYYRDALVRAMYRNAQANVFPDGTHLVKFYENAIGCGSNTLNREDLLCSSLFENPELLRNVDPSEALHRKS